MPELEGAVIESSSPSSKPANQSSRLLSLPPELVDRIFSLAALHGGLPSRPLCKALLPFFRRSEWAVVATNSDHSVASLADQVAVKPEKGHLVKRFTVALPLLAQGSRAPAHLERLQPHLSGLVSLKIKTSRELLQMMLRPSFLEGFPALRSLELDWYPQPRTPIPCILPPLPSLPNLRNLVVANPCFNDPALFALLSTPRALQYLALYRSPPTPYLALALKAVQAKSKLQFLTVHSVRPDPYASNTTPSRLPLLGRFSSLQFLSVEELDIVSLWSYLYQPAAANLAHLSLGRGLDVSPLRSFLRDVVSDKALPSLKRLTLDLTEYDAWYPVGSSPYGHDRTGLDSILSTVEARGIRIDGSFLKD
ncbi:hypothetical protein JCM8097_004773 [Rhodosporidiobolus ruineniae]